ncbi:class II glutamine amidotransferase [Candidatus Woesearchaeota archaeon]|nr:class II glutamine amidotransferase [Candidatus Woesearchaeota archaeon]
MCELFAYSAKKKIELRSLPHFTRFLSHCRWNPDGWGIGWFAPAQLVKAPEKATHSRLLPKVINTISTNLLIAHIREASVGKNTYNNTHPFIRMSGRKTWLFAHNGTVGPLKIHLQPLGETDSERLFCYLLEGSTTPKGIMHQASFVKGKKNFLLSDGEYLYAYGDTSLYYLQTPNYVMIATVPLSKEKWVALRNGQMVRCRQGRIIDSREYTAGKKELVRRMLFTPLRIFR